MYCRKCGKLISDDSVFCGYCGAPVSMNDSEKEKGADTVLPGDEEAFRYNADNDLPAYDNRLEKIARQVKEQQKGTEKRKQKKTVLIPIIIGAVVILALVAALIFRDQIGSLFKKESASADNVTYQENNADQGNDADQWSNVKQANNAGQNSQSGINSQGNTAQSDDSSWEPVKDEPGKNEPAKEEGVKTALRVGDHFSFGQYETDDDLTNGKEPLYWIVLETNGEEALIITESVIDAMPYSKSGITWSESTLRQWLNGTFEDQAFSDEEQESIVSTAVTTKNNPTYGTNSGSSTTDDIFLLSGEEAARYFGSDANRKIKGTPYANAHNLFVSKTSYCRWWIRDPGQSDGLASVINGDGVIDYFGAVVGESRYGVRPAMWIRY